MLFRSALPSPRPAETTCDSMCSLWVAHHGRPVGRRPASAGWCGAPSAPVLALWEDRSRPHIEHVRRHAHDSAVYSRRSPGAGWNDPPGAPFLTIRGRRRADGCGSSSDRARRAPPEGRSRVVRGSSEAVRGYCTLEEAERRGPIVGFPRNSGLLARMLIFSGRVPMCRAGPSAHGRISTLLSTGVFPHDSADPPPVGSG
mgnify:FL=1